MGNLLHMANYELAKRLMATLSLGKSVKLLVWELGTWQPTTGKYLTLKIYVCVTFMFPRSTLNDFKGFKE